MTYDFEDDFDIFEDDHDHHSRSSFFPHRSYTMEIVGSVIGLVVVLCIAVLIWNCCCRKRFAGQVIAPPAAVVTTTTREVHRAPAPYPQQQYVVTTYAASPAPQSAAPYPAAAPYPTGAPYPTAAPYPPAAPYPTAAPYPAGMPHPSPYPAQPNAPDANALPPSYDQVMGPASSTPSGPNVKQPPYNPYLSH